jgi:hypothetical protein
MPTALIDTTVLTDCLLKETEQGDRAREAISKFDVVLVPQYAIKEFKAGPLLYFIWLHNRAATSNTWSDVITGAAAVMRQKNRAATALEAIASFESSFAEIIRAKGITSVAPRELDRLKIKEGRLWLKLKIFRAWANRYRGPLRPFAQLGCYAEVAPHSRPNGTIEHAPVKCTLSYCHLAKIFHAGRNETIALRQVCLALSIKPEMLKRAEVLGWLEKSAKTLSDSECRRLGDAVFAIQCPADAVILTTNVSDHAPLAAAVGRSIDVPS